jgi:hypothetical protein
MSKRTITDSKGRPVCDLEVSGCRDEAMLESAHYDDVDHAEAVPEEELTWIEENYPETIAEMAFDNAVMAAEYAFEGDR